MLWVLVRENTLSVDNAWRNQTNVGCAPNSTEPAGDAAQRRRPEAPSAAAGRQTQIGSDRTRRSTERLASRGLAGSIAIATEFSVAATTATMWPP